MPATQKYPQVILRIQVYVDAFIPSDACTWNLHLRGSLNPKSRGGTIPHGFEICNLYSDLVYLDFVILLQLANCFVVQSVLNQFSESKMFQVYANGTDFLIRSYFMISEEGPLLLLAQW